MKIKDLRNKSIKELNDLLNENREKVRDLRFKIASRQLKDVRALRKAKREIAGILTILNQESRIKNQENRNQSSENRNKLKKAEKKKTVT